MRYLPTAIEKLDRKHPGLRQHVEMRRDGHADPATIQRELKERYDEDVPLTTISMYLQRRYRPDKMDRQRRIKERMARTEATIEVIKKEGASEFTRAYIFEQLDEAERRGERIPPAVLLREEREREQLALDREKLRLDVQKAENAKQALKLKLEALKAKRNRVRELVRETGDEGKNAAQALTRIREIYGIGT
jgi:hypothetical protein